MYNILHSPDMVMYFTNTKNYFVSLFNQIYLAKNYQISIILMLNDVVFKFNINKWHCRIGCRSHHCYRKII